VNAARFAAACRDIAACFHELAIAVEDSSSSARDAVYTTRGALPPSMSVRQFHERCRRLHDPGDRRVRKVGRNWSAERDAFVTPRAQRKREAPRLHAVSWTADAGTGPRAPGARQRGPRSAPRVRRSEREPSVPRPPVDAPDVARLSRRLARVHPGRRPTHELPADDDLREPRDAAARHRRRLRAAAPGARGARRQSWPGFGPGRFHAPTLR
jgi:hypothetical protein